MNEVWKIAEGYTNYEVSNIGNIRHADSKQKVTAFPIDYNYYRVHIKNDSGKWKHVYIHDLVARAFIPNPDPTNLTEVNHINEDKTDNTVENLEWISHEANCNYGTRNERIARANSKPVTQMALDGTVVAQWGSLSAIMRATGWNAGNIGRACNGKTEKAYGYRWCYTATEIGKKAS